MCYVLFIDKVEIMNTIGVKSNYFRNAGGETMPVYEFECADGHITEDLVPMGTGHVPCPHCSKKAKKIISPCTFELKGGGWYADGYSTRKSTNGKPSD
jgi:putative FmdB family regulatory protein